MHSQGIFETGKEREVVGVAGVAVGAAVVLGLVSVEVEVGEAVGVEVGEGVGVEVGEGVIGADSVAVGIGFEAGRTSTSLSIALVDMRRSRFFEAISTWTE